MATDKDAALDALRMWADWRGRRDPLIRNARAAGATITEIMDAGDVAKGTVTIALSKPPEPPKDPAVQLSPAAVAFHHPHYVGAEPIDGFGGGIIGYRFMWRPFTGSEPDPYDDDTSLYTGPAEALTEVDRRFLQAEWRSARAMWGQARFRVKVTPMIRAAVEVWKAYARARAAMDAAYARFVALPDQQWRSALLALTGAHDAAMAAAIAWDRTAGELSRAEWDHLREVGEENELRVRDVAAELGIDVSAWLLGCDDEYRSVPAAADDWRHAGEYSLPPLTRDVRAVVLEQENALKRVGQLTGDSE